MKSEKEATQSVETSKISKVEYLQKCLLQQKVIMLISTLAMVFMVVVVLTIQYNNGFMKSCQPSSNTSTRNVRNGSQFCNCKSEEVICTKVSNAAQIETDMYNLQDCAASHLIITDSTFTKIPSFFLKEYSSTFKKFTVTASQLMEIEDDAFNSDTFMYLQEITFRANDRIRYLKKDSFRGHHSMNVFSLEMGVHTNVKFEKNFLENMNTISTLQLHRCILTEEHLANITSSDVYLIALQTVDFRYNSIPTINARAFEKLISVTQFFLSSSNIYKIEPDAFYGLIGLKDLYLSTNILSTLPEGVFGSQVTRVDLHDNMWQCDCKLLWLKDLYMNSNVLKKSGKNLTCSNFNNKEFSEVVFCTEEESSTSSVTTTEASTTTKAVGTTDGVDSEITEETTEISTTTQGEPSKRYKEIICRDWIRSPLNISGFGDLVYNQTIQTAYESLFFEFYDLDIDPVELTVVIEGNITGFHLLWFNSHNISETGCVTNMANTIVLNILKRTETYTFCLLYKEQVTVSPFDCFGFEIRVSLPERAWIQNKYSKVCMITGGIVSLSIVVLSAIITYFCIRKHPVLIKGNKRVIIVGKKKPEAPTTPKEYERPVYIPPSIMSMLSTAAQSTHGYTRIRRRHYQSPRLRSLSEHSIFSNEVSYIRPAGPSNYQLNTWRLRSKIDQKIMGAVEGDVYPPPLPPPNSNIQHLSWEENLYTTL